jgi:hypothetical protein
MPKQYSLGLTWSTQLGPHQRSHSPRHCHAQLGQPRLCSGTKYLTQTTLCPPEIRSRTWSPSIVTQSTSLPRAAWTATSMLRHRAVRPNTWDTAFSNLGGHTHTSMERWQMQLCVQICVCMCMCTHERLRQIVCVCACVIQLSCKKKKGVEPISCCCLEA